MRDITLEELLEAGCHFGHQTNRRNPRADEFIFEARDNVHIINLEATRDGLIKAAAYVKDLSEKGGSLVVVGTKRQARQIVKDTVAKAREAGALNLHTVTYRWIGGMITNFDEVKKNYKKLKDISELLKSGRASGYTKRELVQFEKQRTKLEEIYGGINTLEKIPDALFIIDTHLEKTAISEAHNMDVELVGIVDTNADPAVVTYPIPANDDAVGSIKIITEYIVEAWMEGSHFAKATRDKQNEVESEKLKVKSEEAPKQTESKEEKKVEEPKKVEKVEAVKPEVKKTDMAQKEKAPAVEKKVSEPKVKKVTKKSVAKEPTLNS